MLWGVLKFFSDNQKTVAGKIVCIRILQTIKCLSNVYMTSVLQGGKKLIRLSRKIQVGSFRLSGLLQYCKRLNRPLKQGGGTKLTHTYSTAPIYWRCFLLSSAVTFHVFVDRLSKAVIARRSSSLSHVPEIASVFDSLSWHHGHRLPKAGVLKCDMFSII